MIEDLRKNDDRWSVESGLLFALQIVATIGK
jgi:hypothetical protein